MSNLTYLIDQRWVKTIDQEKTVATGRGTTVHSILTFYEITAQGIEKIEGPSEFQPNDRYPGINIEATGANVITLGDGNVVQVQFRQLFHQLNELKHAISRSDRLSDPEKLEVAVDIETLMDQLAKAEPDREVTRRLWPSIEKASNVAGLTGFALELASAIQRIMN